MAARRRTQFVYWLALWLCAALVGLVAAGSFTVDQFYAAGLIGVIVIARVTAPAGTNPRWRGRLNRVILACLVGFVALVTYRIVQVFPWGAI